MSDLICFLKYNLLAMICGALCLVIIALGIASCAHPPAPTIYTVPENCEKFILQRIPIGKVWVERPQCVKNRIYF